MASKWYSGGMRIFKSRLKEIMQERGIKQNWLAKKVGVRPSTISKIVNEKTTPTLELALLIADVLELTVHDIWEITKDI